MRKKRSQNEFVKGFSRRFSFSQKYFLLLQIIFIWQTLLGHYLWRTWYQKLIINGGLWVMECSRWYNRRNLFSKPILGTEFRSREFSFSLFLFQLLAVECLPSRMSQDLRINQLWIWLSIAQILGHGRY